MRFLPSQERELKRVREKILRPRKASNFCAEKPAKIFSFGAAALPALRFCDLCFFEICRRFCSRVDYLGEEKTVERQATYQTRSAGNKFQKPVQAPVVSPESAAIARRLERIVQTRGIVFQS